MPCYSPLRGVVVTAPGGVRSLSFSQGVKGKGVSLPCGYCLGCRLERARQWAVRIMHESKMHESNSFLTLTYDPEHMPLSGSLSVETCQLFFKRLRKKLAPARIRFFLCGEYGEKMGRPHYHAIVFGWFPSDAVHIKGSGELSLFSSRLLSETWGLGFTSVGRVTFDSASYVANYATKKLTSNRGAEAERLSGRRSEFLLMSRGGRNGTGGIGKAWFDKFGSDVFPSDEVIIRGHSCRPPRFYDKLLQKRAEEECPPGRFSAMRDSIKLKREEEADKLEEMVLHSGDVVKVAPSRNARRLKVREVVARAKFALKRRTLESE